MGFLRYGAISQQKFTLDGGGAVEKWKRKAGEKGGGKKTSSKS